MEQMLINPLPIVHEMQLVSGLLTIVFHCVLIIRL